MTTVFVSSVIDAPAADVWAAVRDFNGMPQWHPLIADSLIENGLTADRIGCVRYFHTRDGGSIREQLLALSDYDYTFTYAILESPMGVSDYVATLKLTPVTDGDRCFGEWSAEFTAAPERETELKRFVSQEVFLAGFHALQARMVQRR
ncbi:polyketide cyclase [Bordetella sp. H567]|uniref:SRPBCC family protein n=1 Tax=Bordetella sp. H567 TaxID=1697043 RepID=UPI00081C4377|nr:SRPBCC family protein [Bordetella sp. H567]AOB31134.1 polyketide cyclase [Bordetella sp. H567]